MPTMQEVRDQRASAWAQAQEFRTRFDGGATMSAEDDQAWTRALDDVDRLGAIIEREERSAALDRSFATIDESTTHVDARGQATASAESQYRSIFERFCRYGGEGLNGEERATLQANFAVVAPDGTRAQSAGTNSAGGYTVPQGFWAKVTESMKYYGGAADGAEIITTDAGNTLPWPTNDDTSNVGYQLGENTQASNEGDLSFGQKSLGGYFYASGPVLVSYQLLQDTGIDFEGFLARKMGQRLGRIQNTKQTTGTGSSQPQGYVTGATTGKTTASATAITWSELIDLVHSVDAAYRVGPCRFKLHDLVLAYIRKLLDSTNRPLWQPSLSAGADDTILGYPYSLNNDMASAVTTGLKTVAFGNFAEAFVIRKVTGGQIMRLAERYADYLQVGFLGYDRMDCLVQNTSAVKLLVQA